MLWLFQQLGLLDQVKAQPFAARHVVGRPGDLDQATRGLNTLADAGKFDRITQRINGGQNGAADRQALYVWALKVLA